MKLLDPKPGETRKRISEAQKGKPRLNQRGDKHGGWKGDNVGYMGVHAYLREHYSQMKISCEHCGKRERLQFAKKKDHGYTRDIEKYLILCQWCHLKYDGQFGGEPWNKGNITTYSKVCLSCNTEFQGKKKTSIYCSNKCSAKSRPTPVREKDITNGRWLVLHKK